MEVTIKALVTGASGHIGYHICKILSAEGVFTRALIRNASYTEHLLKLPVELQYGDLFSPDSLEKAMRGVDTVFHAAAIYKLTERAVGRYSEDPIVATAVEGTKNLFEAASRSGIRKVVYTSTVETVGQTSERGKLLDESCFNRDPFYVYSSAKIEAEKTALEMCERLAVDTVLCNPATVIGKDDFRLTPSNSMLLNFARKPGFFVEGGQSLVDVEDVARGHINAARQGKNRERYILSGDNLEIRELLLMIRKILGSRGPFIRLNRMVLYPVSVVFELASRFIGKQSFITRRKVMRSIGSYAFFDHAKATRELDYRPRPIMETLPATLQWLMEKYR